MAPNRLLVVATCVAAAALHAGQAGAQLRTAVVVAGLNQPLDFVQDPSDPLVQYVVEQGGRIRVLQRGALRATDFLDLSGSITSGGERGLLGLAFPPDYARSGRFYVNFTNPSGDTVVARFRRSAADRLAADPASRFDLLWSTGERVIRQPFANHNGGDLVFGPDGYLYVGMGDGGSGDDPGNRAQDPRTLLGKMLRIDVGVPDDDPRGFRVPPDNPFLSGVPILALPEIWDIGLRNPWRYSFDDPARGGTGALVIGDVGQNTYEEIDYEPAQVRGGRNYGWRIREGAHPHIATLPPAFTPLTDPIFDYDHTVGVSIIGGVVYRGTALGPDYVGRYFYADLNGRVWSLGLSVDRGTGEAHVVDQVEHTADLGGAAVLGGMVSFGTDAAGEPYLVNLFTGTVLRILPPPPRGPSKFGPTSGIVGLGRVVPLSWSGAAGESYQVCVDTTNDNTCGTTWRSVGAATTLRFVATAPGTYYWQVRAVSASGVAEADSGAWWSFTVGGPAPPGRLRDLDPDRPRRKLDRGPGTADPESVARVSAAEQAPQRFEGALELGPLAREAEAQVALAGRPEVHARDTADAAVRDEVLGQLP
jgi:glucose/arabinose dehydrogenase